MSVDRRSADEWMREANDYALRVLGCRALEAWHHVDRGRLPAFCPFSQELDRLLYLAGVAPRRSLHEIHDD